MKSLEDIVPKLVDKTRDGSLSWSGHAENSFVTSFGKYRVEVIKWRDEDDGTDGVSVLLSKKDESSIIDSISFDTYSSRYQRLLELYSFARRSALKIDKIIEDVDEELDNIFPF